MSDELLRLRKTIQDVRLGLLRLHKVLLDRERAVWEALNGEASSGQLLQLVINHEQFAWLHAISELIVRIDETLESDAPVTEEGLEALLGDAVTLTTPAEQGDEYQQKYYAALQNEPDVVFAHREVRRLLRA